MKTVFVDVDGVVADMLPEWLRWYNSDYGASASVYDIHGWALHEYIRKSCGMKIYDYLNDPRLYDKVEPIEKAKWGVDSIRDLGYKVVFATATPRSTPYRKYDWLDEHGFKPTLKTYLEIQDKSLLHGEFLLDDNITNVLGFSGKGYLFNQYHNEAYLLPINRATDWEDFVNILKGEKFE
jgi:5'(3')-deoxyribonucleotidase